MQSQAINPNDPTLNPKHSSLVATRQSSVWELDSIRKRLGNHNKLAAAFRITPKKKINEVETPPSEE